jgi:hypothetical protein
MAKKQQKNRREMDHIDRRMNRRKVREAKLGSFDTKRQRKYSHIPTDDTQYLLDDLYGDFS